MHGMNLGSLHLCFDGGLECVVGSMQRLFRRFALVRELFLEGLEGVLGHGSFAISR